MRSSFQRLISSFKPFDDVRRLTLKSGGTNGWTEMLTSVGGWPLPENQPVFLKAAFNDCCAWNSLGIDLKPTHRGRRFDYFSVLFRYSSEREAEKIITRLGDHVICYRNQKLKWKELRNKEHTRREKATSKDNTIYKILFRVRQTDTLVSLLSSVENQENSWILDSILIIRRLRQSSLTNDLQRIIKMAP